MNARIADGLVVFLFTGDVIVDIIGIVHFFVDVVVSHDTNITVSGGIVQTVRAVTWRGRFVGATIVG